MQENDLTALLNLLTIQGLGPKKVTDLVTHYGSCSGVFDLSANELCQVNGITLKLAEIILSFTDHDYGRQELESCTEKNISLVTRWDDDYPLLLKTIVYSPPLLYTKGRKLEKRTDVIGIVGSRLPTHYGISMAERISTDVVKRNWTSVSGLARGIDTVVHRTTVQENGRTIAVLGNGLDRIYPAENQSLAENIMERGTLVSEFPLGTKPEAVNFPLRNRIISGLSHGIVVIEAGTRSGAILTALNAVDQNREVFAVPGRLTDPMSTGCNRLIKNGAIPLLSNDTIYENIKSRLFKPCFNQQSGLTLDISEKESRILDYITYDPVTLEELERNTGETYQPLLTTLLEMELKGIIRQLSGGMYVRA